MARGAKKLTKAGKVEDRREFTKKARAKLARRRSVKLVVRLTVADAAGNKGSASRRVTVKR